MTGKELKKLVAEIPDDAEVYVVGSDDGGYDAVTCKTAQVVPVPPYLYDLKGINRQALRLEGIFNEKDFSL